MARQDHLYVNLPRTLLEEVDTCVSGFLKNGAQVYRNRKDFIIRSIQKQIDFDKQTRKKIVEIIKSRKPNKEESLSHKEISKVLHPTKNKHGGNRSKNV